MKIFLLTLVAVLTVTLAQGQRLYVSPAGSSANDGLSWATPTTIDRALLTGPREIWVARGTYAVAAQGNRNGLVVPAGTKLYGGFEGHESKLTERTLAPTVLDGGGVNGAFTVVRLNSDSRGSVTVLDGFTISGGSSRSYTHGFDAKNVGGGLYVSAGRNGVEATHQISNCKFVANAAHHGGAVFVQRGSPIFTNCSFLNNEADFNGGAIYVQASAGQAAPVFRNCSFTGNISQFGGAMTNNGANGSATPLLINCNFVQNTASSEGAAIYNLTEGAGEAEPVVRGSTFRENVAMSGGDIANDAVSPFSTASQRESHRTRHGGTLRPATARKK